MTETPENAVVSQTQDNPEEIENEKQAIRLDPRTIFVDQIDFNVKHPLKRSWTLWYDSPQKKTNHQNWFDNVKQVFTFQSVEDFWG
jgi:translation initiation factor 4E